jgi:hypothetical protein
MPYFTHRQSITEIVPRLVDDSRSATGDDFCDLELVLFLDGP